VTSTSCDLVVIGAGPAGLTAALYAHRAGLQVVILGGDTPGGQVMTHYRVDNYPGVPGGVTGAQLMAGWLNQVLEATGSMPVPESVHRVDLSGPRKRAFVTGDTYECAAVIVATGARPRRLGVPGEVELGGKGVFYCATCDAPLLRTMESRRAAVVGGGDTAFHTALALLPHADSVTLVTRGADPRAKPVLVEKLLEHPGTAVVSQRSVRAIVGDGRVSGLHMENVVTGQWETLPVDAVFIGVGQAPVTEFLDGALLLDDRGFIVTDDRLNTSAAGVFAAGDVRNTLLRQIVTAAADGALAAQSAAQYLRMSSM